jgi:hypothetical protein
MKAIFSVLLLTASAAAQPGATSALQRGFVSPTGDSRPMMRWWWFGPAVAKPELERELRAMKAGGIGGVEIQPVYPLALDDARTGIKNLTYLSDEFLDAVRFTNEKARELGMRVDVTMGSGWPYGGPHIPVAHASGRLRVDKVKASGRTIPVPPLSAGEELTAVFTVEGQQYQQLAGTIAGHIFHAAADLPPGEVWFFISSRTGMQLKRPGIGGEGFVLDHYSRPAIELHLKAVGDRLMTAFQPRPYAIFCDSLEVYGGDWTPDFPAEFERRRGYSIVPLLPALVTDMGDVTRQLRHDWGRALTELTEANFYQPVEQWATRNHTQFRIQGYGLPPAAISSYALADLPEGEGPQWKTLGASRWAASASHILGKPVTSSETWTWLHSPAFRATPLDLKAEADLHFLQGINQLIGHGWPYTPPGVEYPGWRLYAAAVFGDANPWYHAMPEITRYLQRMSWLLRQGKPANDVAVYLSNAGGWAHLRPGQVSLIEAQRKLIGGDVVGRIVEAGYNVDFFDDGLLDRVLRDYKVIVMPNVETLPPATARKLAGFAQRGGIVVPTRRLPAAAPGYRATAADHAAVKAAVGAFAANLVEDENRDLGNKLRALFPPDVAVTAGALDLGAVHRKVEGAEVYFVANTGNAPLRAEATFRVHGLEAEWWDPMTGRTSAAPVLRRGKDGVTVALDLAAYGSQVIVFSAKATAPAPLAGEAKTFDISRGWSVKVGDAPAAAWETLRSWSGDEATRYYSGIATYEKTVELPAGFPRREVAIDFGEGRPLPASPLRNGMMALLDAPVREAAVVFVNGQRAGAAWCAPYRVDVTPFLKPGANQIRIAVGNTAMNYMAGHRLPGYRLLNMRYGVRFEPQDMDQIQVLPSGLLGPVRLIGK